MTADHAAIRARLDAITDGPWEALTDPGDRKIAPHHVIDTNDEKRWFRAEGEQDLQAFHNAHFIAHAPEDVRALLNECEQLRRERDEFERRMRGYQRLGLAAIFLADTLSDDPDGDLRQMRDEWLAEQTALLREERNAAIAVIEDAPHEIGCGKFGLDQWGVVFKADGECDCFKSHVRL